MTRLARVLFRPYFSLFEVLALLVAGQMALTWGLAAVLIWVVAIAVYRAVLWALN